MKIDWRTNKDLWAGIHYIVIGAVAMWIATSYPFGTALRMGPGYFPTVLGGIMIAMGIYVLLLGFRKDYEKIQGHTSYRAMLALIPIAASAGRDFRWKEIIPLTIGLTIACAAAFIYGLGLPYPLVKGMWGY